MKKRILLLTMCTISSLLFTSCNKGEASSNTTNGGYEFGEKVTNYAAPVKNEKNEIVQLYNSTISLTSYNEDFLDKVFPLFEKRVQDIHIDADRYNYFLDKSGNRINNLKVVNDSYGTNEPVKVSDDLFELLSLSIQLNELTEGYFNPTMGALNDFWTDNIYIDPFVGPGFGDVDPILKPEFKLAKEKMIPYSVEDPLKNYIVLNETDKTVLFKKYKNVSDIDISLGGIAKGFGMYEAEKLLKQYDFPMMIDGGQSSLALINKRPDKDYYSIGVVSPYVVQHVGNKLLYKVDVNPGTNISTSGDYLHYMYVTDKPCNKNDAVPCKRLTKDLGDGKFRYIRRHHILNPFTGYSENHYRVINVNSSDRADVLDALTTALFNIDIVNDKETFDRVIDNFESAFDIKVDYLLEQEYSYINEKGKEWSKINVFMNEGYNKLIDRDYTAFKDFVDKETIFKD